MPVDHGMNTMVRIIVIVAWSEVTRDDEDVVMSGLDIKAFIFGGLGGVLVFWVFLFTLFHYPLYTILAVLTGGLFLISGWFVLSALTGIEAPRDE